MTFVETVEQALILKQYNCAMQEYDEAYHLYSTRQRILREISSLWDRMAPATQMLFADDAEADF